MRSPKAILLIFASLAVTSALVASSAAAQFESEAENTRITVSTNDMQKFSPSSGSTAVECTTVSIPSTFIVPKKVTAVSVGVKYTNCEAFLGATPVNVFMNSCIYVFHLATGSTTGTVDIECPENAKIEVEIGKICEYQIGTQTGLSSVTFKNTGSGTTREVIVEPNVKGITSTRTTNDFFCPAADSTGTYTGNLTVTGETSGGTHVGIFVD
jgi:hypothetical protein